MNRNLKARVHSQEIKDIKSQKIYLNDILQEQIYKTIFYFVDFIDSTACMITSNVNHVKNIWAIY